MYLTIEEIKKHLNIDDDFTDDDEYLLSLEEVAEGVIEKHIDDSLEDIASMNGGELPRPLLHAMLLYIGNLYANRESISYSSAIEIPFAYDYILSLYKSYGNRKAGGEDK